MTSLCKKESICAVHEKQTQAKQLSVKQVRQHGARLQVTDSDGITMRKRLATQPERAFRDLTKRLDAPPNGPAEQNDQPFPMRFRAQPRADKTGGVPECSRRDRMRVVIAEEGAHRTVVDIRPDVVDLEQFTIVVGVGCFKKISHWGIALKKNRILRQQQGRKVLSEVKECLDVLIEQKCLIL